MLVTLIKDNNSLVLVPVVNLNSRLTLPYKRRICRLECWLLLLLAALWAWPSAAHDIPSKVTLHAYIKPHDQQLNVLVRVPLAALSEINFPQRGVGYLDFSRADPAVQDAARLYIRDALRLYENGAPIRGGELAAARVALPSDRSFVDYETALEKIHSPPLTDAEDLYWSQALLDVHVRFPIQSEASRFAFESELARLGLETNTDLRFVLPGGSERLFNYFGNPGRVELDPSLWQALSRFVVLGFEHILQGFDHLLFLFALIIPLRSIRALIPVITSFTLAHSITLIAAAFGMAPNVLWFPAFIETLIALSIVYMACENILGPKLDKRWLAAFGFGLVHGFGFSFLLADTMQFAGGHLISSLLAFNIGVELGQLLVLAVAVPLLALLFKYVNTKTAVILFSALVGHSAWHWMTERGGELLQYDFRWPAMDAAFFAALMRWGMLALIVAAAVWAMLELARRLGAREL